MIIKPHIKKLRKSEFADNFGFIGQGTKGNPKFDRRDSLQREGMLLYAECQENYGSGHEWGKLVIKHYRVAPDKWVRHPKGISEDDFAKDYRSTSGDQLISAMIGLGEAGHIDVVRDFMKSLMGRFGFIRNTIDIAGNKKLLPDWWAPGRWGALIRSARLFGALWVILLYLSDILFFINTHIKIIKSHANPEHSDDLNYFLQLHVGNRVMPTWFMRKSKELYFSERGPVRNKDTGELKYGIEEVFDHYFHESSGAPFINEVYRPIIKDFKKRE